MLREAIDRLLASPGVTGVQVSSFYETQPVGGPPGQGPYLNAAAGVHTTLRVQDFFELLRQIESDLGRIRTVRWGPRTIDLDLLLFDDLVLHTTELTVPHPHMHGRRFVLEPLAEIAPDIIHPTSGSSIVVLLSALH